MVNVFNTYLFSWMMFGPVGPVIATLFLAQTRPSEKLSGIVLPFERRV